MKKRCVLVSMVLLLLLLPAALGLTLDGKKIGPITYQPGTAIINHYTIRDAAFPVEVTVDGGIFKNISVTPVENDEFDLVIIFPTSEYVPPGTYSFGLTVREKPPKEQAIIATSIAVSKGFTVIVYSYDQEISPSLNIPNVNRGSNITAQLTVSSMGYPDIGTVQGKITLFTPERQILATRITAEKFLPGLETIAFIEKFAAGNLSAGQYYAEALVTYDGKEKSVNSTFLIGTMDLQLKQYTRQITTGFSDFSMTLVNNWGNALRNVYAIVLVNGQELLHTPSITLEPWSETELRGITRAELNPGTYAGTLRLFFEGEQKEIPITLEVVLPKALSIPAEENIPKPSLLPLFLLLTALVIIIIVLAVYIRRSRT